MLALMPKSKLALLAASAIALAASSAALAATVPSGYVFAGKTDHKRYALTIDASCPASAKTCPHATDVAIIATLGLSSKPKPSCPHAAYQIGGKISGTQFSTTGEFATSKKLVVIKVAAKFGLGKKTTLKGSITGPKACGGTDTFSFTGKHLLK